MSLIPYLPDFWLFLLIGIFIIIIYRFMPDDLKSIIKRNLKAKYIFYVVLMFVFIYFRNKWGIVSDHSWIAGMKYATFLVFLTFLCYFGVKSWLYEFRYNTNHLISNNLSGSCHRFQMIEGSDGIMYGVFFIGGSGTSDEKFVLPWPWVKKIAVAPLTCCRFLGNQIEINAQTPHVDFLDLDEDVAEFIERDNFGRWIKEEIYLGFAPLAVETKYPEYRVLENNIKKQNARINELKEMLRGKLTTVKGFVSDTMGVTEKLKGKDWRSQQKPMEE